MKIGTIFLALFEVTANGPCWKKAEKFRISCRFKESFCAGHHTLFTPFFIFQMSLKQETPGGEKYELRFGHMPRLLAAMLLWGIQNQRRFGKTKSMIAYPFSFRNVDRMVLGMELN